MKLQLYLVALLVFFIACDKTTNEPITPEEFLLVGK